MVFIDKLSKCALRNAEMKLIRDMLVGTCEGYERTKKTDALETIIKLSYMLGKQVGKEESRKCDWKEK